MTRPSPDLERNQCLAQAWASRATSASPEPRPRAQSPPRPSLGLERNQRLARASASTPGFPRTIVVPLMLRRPCFLPYHGRIQSTLFLNSRPCNTLPMSLWVRHDRKKNGRRQLTPLSPCLGDYCSTSAGQSIGPRTGLPLSKQGSATPLTGMTMPLPLPQGCRDQSP